MGDVVTTLEDVELPFRRKASVRKVDFESGMSMVRLVLREGTRITQVDLDEVTANKLASALSSAAQDI